jgi:uncharacterized membrane protein YcaP (DUF421 family)
MTKQRLGLRVAATVFAVVSLAQITRIGAHIEIDIAGRVVPMWPSAIAAVIAAFLSIWLWILSKRGQES